MRRFSANLGFLWADRPLPDAIRAAGAAGFDAVECHFPYATPTAEVRAALAETGLPMLSLNTRPGNPGEFGLAALKGREDEARAAIDQALDYAKAIGAGAVHVMAGVGGDDATFRANLAHACAQARGLTILIEPINPHDVPGYHLQTPQQAVEVIRTVDHPALRMMFDCYHVGRSGLDIAASFAACRAVIGHVQFAAVPDRGAPDHGTVDFGALLPRLDWDGPFGAEYRPGGDTGASLGWMDGLR